MSKIQIYTGDDRKAAAGRAVMTQGSIVMVGTEKMDQVLSIALEAGASDVWTVVVRIAVDPNDLFQPKGITE
jgi:hypothetical protein